MRASTVVYPRVLSALRGVMKNTHNNPLENVTFTKAQIALLEKQFGTWSNVGKTITMDSNLPLLNREAGKQDVLDFIRERVI